MDPIVEAITNNWFWSVVGGVIVVGILMGTIESIVTKFARERSRREIAAYIAEGSMTPEQGERLMKADAKPESRC